MKPLDLTLYLVTHCYDFSEEYFLSKIKEACQNGVTLVQLREKTETTRHFFELAVKVKKITDYYQIPLIINDRVDICLAIDAAGVHIGDDELPVAVVRQLIGPDKYLGVSTKDVQQAKAAAAAGADHLGVGAIFATSTKTDAQYTSIETLREISEAVEIPIVAIGGITLENLHELKAGEVDGIAIVSELMLADDIALMSRRLKSAVTELRKE
ncbi:thiamine phosphate synthase [Vagococcus sp.]|uniref:thiamine phosphate synthase n=1 Tax=Vagococcus sp. TaxID=1933889 RepID=UPI003F9E9B5C